MAKVIRRPGPGKAKLEILLQDLRDAYARVGWFPGAVYGNGTPVAYVATIHENGVPEKGIPARPMLAPTVEKNEETWRKASRDLAARVAKGELTNRQAMEQLALMAVDHLKATIRGVKSPELAKETVKARERKKERATDEGVSGTIVSTTKPLQETNHLHDSVQSEVADGKPPAEWGG